MLVETARDNGVILQVGHIERFNPVMGLIEERLTAPKFIEAHRLSPFPNRSMDIGVVLDVMIHDLEIILHLVRSELESIDAVGVPVLRSLNCTVKGADPAESEAWKAVVGGGGVTVIRLV